MSYARLGSRPCVALVGAIILAMASCSADSGQPRGEGQPLPLLPEEGLTLIEKLIAEKQFAAAQTALDGMLKHLERDPTPLMSRLETALVEGRLDGEFVNTLITTASYLRERGAVADEALTRMVSKGLSRILAAGESEEGRREAHLAAQRLGQVFALTGAGSQHGPAFETVVVQALALPSTPPCDVFRAHVLGTLRGGGRLGAKVTAALEELPPQDPRREQLAIFVGRHLDMNELLPFARQLGPGPNSSGAVVKVLSQYSFEREPTEVFAVLMSLTEHGALFGSDTLALGCAAWGRRWARENAPGAHYARLIEHVGVFARTTPNDRTRSFATVALYGLLGHLTEAPVTVDLSRATLEWIKQGLTRLGSEQTADDHRYHAHLAHCYGCVADDPSPLYVAWNRCVERGQYSRASGLQVSLDLMRMRNVLSDEGLTALRRFEEATLRPSDKIPTSVLASKTLQIAFRRALPQLESYCRLVLDAHSDEKLRRMAQSYLDRAPDLRAWHARRRQKRRG